MAKLILVFILFPVTLFAQGTPPTEGFTNSTVREMARALAAKPYQAPDRTLPSALTDITYDQYRSIRFKPERALWRGEKRGFEAQFFHRGFLFQDRIAIFEVADGRSTPLAYNRGDFTFGDDIRNWPNQGDLGFAGFRLHAKINQADYLDEVCVFLGASYFRAVGKGEAYGLSARGLAIDTGERTGEEFPVFKAFWIERPTVGATSIVVHALLDSKSVTGAYRFTIHPGETTLTDVEMTLYPRVDILHLGLAPLTSMYFFGPGNRAGYADYRPEVHDSDGLGMVTGHGERIWRPLNNPVYLQISAFADDNPRVFGMVQRQRDFSSYLDLEARYHHRPSVMVEPVGNWGEGSVVLFEIPTKEEIHDNIATFWRPKAPLLANGEYPFAYRMRWDSDVWTDPKLARFTRTGVSAVGDEARLFVLDLSGDRLKTLNPQKVKGLVQSDKGRVYDIVAQPNPETGGWRLNFRVDVKSNPSVELRAQLVEGTQVVSETWLYRWTRE